MSSQPTYDDPTVHDEQPEAYDSSLLPDGVVEVRRNGGLAAAIGGVAAVVAILYLSRASGTGAWIDWTLTAVMGLLAAAWLQGFVDARTPLLVADQHGIRVRQGRAWHGMPWNDIDAVEHLPRHGLLRDGRLEVFTHDGAAVAVPLAISTSVVGDGGDLTDALARLTRGASEIVELDRFATEDAEAIDEIEAPEDLAEDSDPVEPTAPVEHVETTEPGETTGFTEPVATTHGDATPDAPSDGPRLPDPRPTLARGIGAVASRLRRGTGGSSADVSVDAPFTGSSAPSGPPAGLPLVASATPSPLREPLSATRIEVRSDLTLDITQGANALRLDPSEHDDGSAGRLPEARELRRPGSVSLVEDTLLWGDRVSPIAKAGEPVEPIVIEDFSAVPAADPVIGPELAAARTRLGLSVDQLAERTRIRPHVIESIEVDDFTPCGGDFYARGHLRTLARVLGTDAAPLLAEYDAKYADAPISPRRVFEAELATGVHGGIRGTRGGPNWSVLVATVMVLVLAWSVARLVMDSPSTLNEAPTLNGSGGLAAPGEPVPVLLDAAGGGATVKVVDGNGKTVFDGDLAFGQTKSLAKVVQPVQVITSDGSLEVSVDGVEAQPVGDTGTRSTRTFGSR
ncbi:hypothetical protein GHK92_15425 [Nocardioides sp. dk4132]|uniref:helix-turn-helix domain-containing protein n=1 Tax=unclassified Nocardioides TaxID=2615069 RepID=UPI001294D1F4|nr:MULTISPECIES: helix-turn-helix domain-containing protein [unclassified Nocardioides]MQW77264.1 hypothetical protein [Nocardioides sp. dk4132]QGA08020.1 hypothetical protein GFH29_11900 [Nocardioides sp. dk884]